MNPIYAIAMALAIPLLWGCYRQLLWLLFCIHLARSERNPLTR